MLRQTKIKSSLLDLIEKVFFDVVLFFIYFLTILSSIQVIGVNAQGNRGVIINNQKFNDSSGIQYVLAQQNNSTKLTTFMALSTTQVIFLDVSL